MLQELKVVKKNDMINTFFVCNIKDIIFFCRDFYIILEISYYISRELLLLLLKFVQDIFTSIF